MSNINCICSDYHLITNEIEKLKDICKKNRYPERVIDKCIFAFFEKIYSLKKNVTDITTEPKTKLMISLEYLGNESHIVKKRLQQIIKNTLPNCNLIVVFTSNTRLRNGFSFKDRIPECLRSHLIYKFQCGNCNISYVGKTYRHFQVRYSEHLGISKLTNKQLHYRENLATAVRKHIIDDKHDNSPESFKIMGYAKMNSIY